MGKPTTYQSVQFRGATSESDEANNTRCTTTTVTVSPPDLIVSALSSTATTANAGATVALSNSVKNQGGSAAGSSVLAFRLSVNNIYGDADDIPSTSTRSVASLNPGAVSTATTSVLIPATTPAGTYYLCAMADKANTVLESEEANNSACTTTTITVPPSDLAMTALLPLRLQWPKAPASRYPTPQKTRTAVPPRPLLWALCCRRTT